MNLFTSVVLPALLGFGVSGIAAMFAVILSRTGKSGLTVRRN